MIKVLDNVYDLVTLNMEQRFSERYPRVCAL